MGPFLRKLLVALPLFAGTVLTVPHRLAGWEADAHFEGDAAVQERLARGLRDTTGEELVSHPFRTGSPHFDSEWLFGTYMMAGMGFGQLALAHPEREPELRRDMERCIDGMTSDAAKAYDVTTWGEDPLAEATLAGTRGHVAYLGYLNLVLGMLRRIDPKNRYAALNDRVSAALERRFQATTGFVETFPDATFPVDNASGIGSLGLHQRVTGASHAATILAFRERTNRLVRQDDGLLVQIVATNGAPRDVGRGSGTFLAAYFTAFADRELSASLYTAGKRALYKEYAGFGTMREHAAAHPGSPDIDAGPVLFGLGVSSSGFAVGPARAHGDRETFRGLVSLVHLFGLPVDSSGTRTYTTGGPIGDAILFAMLTAPPPESVAPELTASRDEDRTLATVAEGGAR